jgi:hypothetical protein
VSCRADDRGVVPRFGHGERGWGGAGHRSNKERKLTVFLVKALFQAWKLQSSVDIAGMKPRAISVELGLAPSMVVKFA